MLFIILSSIHNCSSIMFFFFHNFLRLLIIILCFVALVVENGKRFCFVLFSFLPHSAIYKWLTSWSKVFIGFTTQNRVWYCDAGFCDGAKSKVVSSQSEHQARENERETIEWMNKDITWICFRWTIFFVCKPSAVILY